MSNEEAYIDQLNKQEEEEDYTPSSTYGDYSPPCPWGAPGMCADDFI